MYQVIKCRKGQNDAKILVAGIGELGNYAVEQIVSSNLVKADLLSDSEIDTFWKMDTHTVQEEELRGFLGEYQMLLVLYDTKNKKDTKPSTISVAEAAKKLGIVTVGVAVKPFSFEAEERQLSAKEAAEVLRKTVDTLIEVSPEQVMNTVNSKCSMKEVKNCVAEVLLQAVRAISGMIHDEGAVVIDFEDVQEFLQKGRGKNVFLGVGRESGDCNWMSAVQRAVQNITDCNSDFFEHPVENILLYFRGDGSLVELNEAVCYVEELVEGKADILFCCTSDDNIKETLATVMAIQ